MDQISIFVTTVLSSPDLEHHWTLGSQQHLGQSEQWFTDNQGINDKLIWMPSTAGTALLGPLGPAYLVKESIMGF